MMVQYINYSKTVIFVWIDRSYCCFFFQAEDGIRDLVRSRGLGDVYKRQHLPQLRKKLGIVFQDFKLLDDRNVYNNLAFVLHVTETPRTVSYTHLTLPTSDLVQISVVAVSLKKKKKNKSIEREQRHRNDKSDDQRITHATRAISTTTTRQRT